MKLYFKIGALIAGLSLVFLAYRWVTSFVVVKKNLIENYVKSAKKDSISVATLSKELDRKDSIVFDLQQTIDLNTANVRDFQTVIKGLNDENKRLKNNESSCCAEVKHLEETGGIRERYFEKRPLSKWFEEVKEKPKFIK